MRVDILFLSLFIGENLQLFIIKYDVSCGISYELQLDADLDGKLNCAVQDGFFTYMPGAQPLRSNTWPFFPAAKPVLLTYQFRAPRDRKRKLPGLLKAIPQVGTASFLSHSVYPNMKSSAQTQRSRKINSLLNGVVASSHCRKACGMGVTVVAIFRDYRSVT